MPAIKLKKVTAAYIAQKEGEEKKGTETKKVAESKKGTEPKKEQQKEQKPESSPQKSKKNLEDVAEESRSKEKSGGKGEGNREKEEKPHNFLDVEILHEKRKRTIPMVEQKCMEWVAEHLERKEGVHVSLPTLYEYYTESCQENQQNVVDIPIFNKYVRENVGKTFGVKEGSPYKGLLKELKERSHEKKPKVQGETLNLKMKDILDDVIHAAKNPTKGIQFRTLKTAVISKYPALRLDLYPKKLLQGLERGIRFGQIELVKGVGMCGFYRLPGVSEMLEEEEKEKEKKKKKKPVKEEEKKEGGEENGTAEGEEGKEEKEGKEIKKKGKKRKSEEAKEEEGKEKVGGEGEEGEPEKKKAKKSNKKKTKKKKKHVDKYRSSAQKHSDPQKIEDAFHLAITYVSDPKEASIQKIKKYIEKHYQDINPDKFKKALEKGEENGLWEQVRGQTYRLEVDEFDPSSSDTLDDKICQAIVATHEPKQASASLIKKYIIDYHPNFNVESRPHLYKHALERACKKGTLRQLSGIGATGTFQLAEQFYPSPAVLAGEGEDESDGGYESEDFQEEVYVVRATKRGRGAGRIPVTVLSKQKDIAKARKTANSRRRR